MHSMSDLNDTLNAAAQGDPRAAAQLLPLVYDALRELARRRLAREAPGHSLQATALVHEAYLRVVKATPDKPWDGRGHFFAAAAEAMRRILVEHARHKQRLKHGGALARHELDGLELAAPAAAGAVDVLALHEALDKLAAQSPRRAELVKLRYFVGCTVPEAAELLGIALSTAESDWKYARAWLQVEMTRGAAADG
jgi:RNA polymerase sigma factor (TIGR02999 family)